MSLKRVVCTLPILKSDHLLIVSILLFLVLILVVSLLLILLYTLKHLQPFPHFQLFVILYFTLLPHLFFNHIPFQNLLHILFITLFPLKKLFGSLLTQLLSLSVHSFFFDLEERLQNPDSKQTCTIIVLLPSSPYLLYRNIQHFPIFFITLNCLKIYIVHFISRQQHNLFTTIRTLRQ